MWSLLLALAMATPQSAPTDPAPFAALRAAYLARDSQAAAAAYGDEGEVVYAYDGAPVETYRGRAAIGASFQSFFDSVAPGQTLDLNFRVTEHTPDTASGVYRLRLGPGETSYGRFDVALGADGRFARDRSTGATLSDFEEAVGPVMLEPAEETLDGGYYDAMLGRYRLPNGCVVAITRSLVRLFAHDLCTHRLRGLRRVSGREWTAGEAVLSEVVTERYVFDAFVHGQSPGFQVTDADGAPFRAQRADVYRREAVQFSGADGVRLVGDLYVPTATGPHPALVLIHGSGEQDRHGYAAIIAQMADALASRGWVVLTYDKRGVGGSGGDWSRARFEVLAGDARAGMAFLETRPEVDRTRIGLGGSSQAGWVAAQAIADGARPADVVLLGAAGSAMTVAEQNLYNTEVRMRCAGVNEPEIALALEQQRAFFDAVRDPAANARLDRLTAQARARPGLADWLFPASAEIDRTGGAWYSTLSLDFDPMPVWRDYRGRAVFILTEFDDSTPTGVVAERLRGIGVEPVILGGAQHLGLGAESLCRGELADATGFSPALFQAFDRLAQP